MNGPENTPYQGGIFTLDVDPPSNYPSRTQRAIFTRKIYHLNVTDKGKIVLLTSEDNSISSALSSIQFLLIEPNIHMSMIQ